MNNYFIEPTLNNLELERENKELKPQSKHERGLPWEKWDQIEFVEPVEY